MPIVGEDVVTRLGAGYPLSLFVAVVLGLALATPVAAIAAPCQAAGALVGGPTDTVSWRAELLGRTSFYTTIPRPGVYRRGFVGPSQTTWLLVLAAASRAGQCWVEVRLPMRPNDAVGWMDGARVVLRPTSWRIVVSLAARTLTLIHAGVTTRRLRVVVGAPATPTPTGLFAIVGVWSSPPGEFVGSWILALTAHSEVLRTFDGGDGLTAIHGRGGASLRDPLGSARSHGCVRLANSAVDWLVHTIGPAQMPGIPVRVDQR